MLNINKNWKMFPYMHWDFGDDGGTFKGGWQKSDGKFEMDYYLVNSGGGKMLETKKNWVAIQESFFSHESYRMMKANPIFVGVCFPLKKLLTKRVENILYDYPVWKVYTSQDNSSHNVERCVGYDCYLKPSPVGSEYVQLVNLVEATLCILNPVQQEFVKMRYFTRTPFKNIAEELAVTERHLYRIRNDILKIFIAALGWR